MSIPVKPDIEGRRDNHYIQARTRDRSKPGRPEENPKPEDDPTRPGDKDDDRDQQWPEPKDIPPGRILENYPLPPHRYRRGKERYTPFLVMRYTAGDGGARPLPPGTTFWHSPDVWVLSSAGYNVPVAGEQNRIVARVNNWGMKDQAGVIVRYWWCNPSLGISEAMAHLIGQTSAFVPSGYSVIVECPTKWTPIIENDGHECVLAEAFAPYWDPLAAPLEPVTDRHVCQKNLHVTEVAPGNSFHLSLTVSNLTGEVRRASVLLRPLTFDRIEAALRAPDIAFKKRLVRTGRGIPLHLGLSDQREYVVARSAIYPLRLLGETATAAGVFDSVCSPSSPSALTVTLEAWESRRLEVKGTVPRDAKPGEAFGFEFQEQLGGIITGGYTLYVVIRGHRS